EVRRVLCGSGVVAGLNGNLPYPQAWMQELLQPDPRHNNPDRDSEVLLNVLAHELEKVSRGITLKPADVFAAVRGVHQRIRGSYAVVALIAGHGLLAFRDPYGIRPLCVGRQGDSVMVASESVTLEGNGFELDRDIQPGEALFVAHDGSTQFEQCAEKTSHNPCIFEYVYLARPDSVLDGISVYQARLNLGKTLAKRLVSTVPPNEIDVVIPIPESSRPSAMELAQLLGLPYREGFVKNRYVGRTFIMPGQGVRKKSVRQKLNVIASEFKGRNVLLVDDSIVRGTTSREIVQMARDAGARKVYLASAAPPVRYPNVYGIDMPTSSELVAHDRTVEEVRLSIGCDALIYQDVDAMKQAIGSLNPNLAGFDASCFDGVYVTGDITLETIERMNQGRDQSEEGQEDNSRLALPNAQTA
ncbi:MAG: amidophosphoribosyltransferase, partial [Hydrogenophaga sp.]|uniref:amidophosphoribosyltransferase n=1 Tax=Hydrogenophaga sp. TaxID=1904254 RepID=UPI0025C10849